MSNDAAAPQSDDVRTPGDTSLPSSDPFAETVDKADEESAGGNAPSAAVSEEVSKYGRYRVVRRQGEGGFGTVYVGHDDTLDRRVAIKVPHGRRSAVEIEAFLSEARRLARLQHPGVVAVHDTDQQDGVCLIVTEFIDGVSLHDQMREQPYSWEKAALLVAQIADALAHAHAESMIHRDIKPGNIMLRRDGRPVLLDFGLAVTDLEATGPDGNVAGTPAYMSPEQARGEGHRVDGRTDIYCLGVVLYQLLAGRRPFRAKNFSELLRKITEDEPQPLRQLAPDVPEKLEAICMRAMSKKMQDRFTTASDFADALRKLASSVAAPLTASPAAGTEPDSEAESGSVERSSRRMRGAERRQVTVLGLMCELDDDDDELETLDPEEQHELSEFFRELCQRSISEFEGTVASAGGQELLICFGYPIAQEDAPHRAVRAARQILSELPEANARLGKQFNRTLTVAAMIHSDEAVAEETSELESVEAVSLVGAARTVTSRLLANAPDGSVTITGSTHRLIGDFFVTSETGTTKVKGAREPVKLFEVTDETAARSRVELVDPGNLTPLIGRDTELSALKDRWEQAAEGMKSW